MAIQQRQKVTIKYAYTIYIVQSISSGQPVLKVCNEQALRILVTQIFYQQKPWIILEYAAAKLSSIA